MCVQDNKRIVKTFLTSVTLNMIFMFFVRGLSLQQVDSPCDGIGDTHKGLQPKLVFSDKWTTRFWNQLTFFNFYNDMVICVTLTFVSHEQIEHCRYIMKDRYEIAKKKVPRTNSFHHFTPLKTYKIGTEGPSEDKEFTFKFRLWEPALPVVGVVAS